MPEEHPSHLSWEAAFRAGNLGSDLQGWHIVRSKGGAGPGYDCFTVFLCIATIPIPLLSLNFLGDFSICVLSFLPGVIRA